MEENKNKSSNFEIEMSLKNLFSVFIKRLWIIILCAVLCGSLTYVYNKKYVVPLYRSEVTFYIVPVSNLDPEYSDYAKLQMEYQGLVYAKQILNTYLQIFQTNTFKTNLSNAYRDNYGKELNGSISVFEIPDTELFKVRVISPSKDDAYEMAQQIEITAPETIIEIIRSDSIRIVDRALKPEFAINNSSYRNTVIGAALGAMIVYGISLLIFLFDRRVKSEEDLKNRYNIPILGGVVDFDGIHGDK